MERPLGTLEQELHAARTVATCYGGPAEDANAAAMLAAIKSLVATVGELRKELADTKNALFKAIGPRRTEQQAAALAKLGLPSDVTEREAVLMLKAQGARTLKAKVKA